MSKRSIFTMVNKPISAIFLSDKIFFELPDMYLMFPSLICTANFDYATLKELAYKKGLDHSRLRQNTRQVPVKDLFALNFFLFESVCFVSENKSDNYTHYLFYVKRKHKDGSGPTVIDHRLQVTNSDVRKKRVVGVSGGNSKWGLPPVSS